MIDESSVYSNGSGILSPKSKRKELIKRKIRKESIQLFDQCDVSSKGALNVEEFEVFLKQLGFFGEGPLTPTFQSLCNNAFLLASELSKSGLAGKKSAFGVPLAFSEDNLPQFTLSKKKMDFASLSQGVSFNGAIKFMELINGVEHVDNKDVAILLQDLKKVLFMNKKPKSHSVKPPPLPPATPSINKTVEIDMENRELYRSSRWCNVVNEVQRKEFETFTFQPVIGPRPPLQVNDRVRIPSKFTLKQSEGASQDIESMTYQDGDLIAIDERSKTCSVRLDDNYEVVSIVPLKDIIVIKEEYCVNNTPRDKISVFDRLYYHDSNESHGKTNPSNNMDGGHDMTGSFSSSYGRFGTMSSNSNNNHSFVGSLHNMSGDSLFRRTDSRSTEQRILDEHCSFTPRVNESCPFISERSLHRINEETRRRIPPGPPSDTPTTPRKKSSQGKFDDGSSNLKKKMKKKKMKRKKAGQDSSSPSSSSTSSVDYSQIPEVGGMYVKGVGLVPGPPTALDVPVFYYDPDDAPDFVQGTYIAALTSLVQPQGYPIMDTTTTTTSGLPSSSTSAMTSSSSSSLGSTNASYFIPEPPPLPTSFPYPAIAGAAAAAVAAASASDSGPPDLMALLNTTSSTSSKKPATNEPRKLVIVKKEKTEGDPPPKKGGGGWQDVMAEMAKRRGGELKKVEEKKPREVGKLKKPGKRRKGEGFLDVVDELKFVISRRSDTKDDEEEEGEEEEEEEEIKEKDKSKAKKETSPLPSKENLPSTTSTTTSVSPVDLQEGIVSPKKPATAEVGPIPQPPPLDPSAFPPLTGDKEAATPGKLKAPAALQSLFKAKSPPPSGEEKASTDTTPKKLKEAPEALQALFKAKSPPPSGEDKASTDTAPKKLKEAPEALQALFKAKSNPSVPEKAEKEAPKKLKEAPEALKALFKAKSPGGEEPSKSNTNPPPKKLKEAPEALKALFQSKSAANQPAKSGAGEEEAPKKLKEAPAALQALFKARSAPASSDEKKEPSSLSTPTVTSSLPSNVHSSSKTPDTGIPIPLPPELPKDWPPTPCLECSSSTAAGTAAKSLLTYPQNPSSTAVSSSGAWATLTQEQIAELPMGYYVKSPLPGLVQGKHLLPRGTMTSKLMDSIQQKIEDWISQHGKKNKNKNKNKNKKKGRHYYDDENEDNDDDDDGSGLENSDDSEETEEQEDDDNEGPENEEEEEGAWEYRPSMTEDSLLAEESPEGLHRRHEILEAVQHRLTITDLPLPPNFHGAIQHLKRGQEKREQAKLQALKVSLRHYDEKEHFTSTGNINTANSNSHGLTSCPLPRTATKIEAFQFPMDSHKGQKEYSFRKNVNRSSEDALPLSHRLMAKQEAMAQVYRDHGGGRATDLTTSTWMAGLRRDESGSIGGSAAATAATAGTATAAGGTKSKSGLNSTASINNWKQRSTSSMSHRDSSFSDSHSHHNNNNHANPGYHHYNGNNKGGNNNNYNNNNNNNNNSVEDMMERENGDGDYDYDYDYDDGDDNGYGDDYSLGSSRTGSTLYTRGGSIRCYRPERTKSLAPQLASTSIVERRKQQRMQQEQEKLRMEEEKKRKEKQHREQLKLKALQGAQERGQYNPSLRLNYRDRMMMKYSLVPERGVNVASHIQQAETQYQNSLFASGNAMAPSPIHHHHHHHDQQHHHGQRSQYGGGYDVSAQQPPMDHGYFFNSPASFSSSMSSAQQVNDQDLMMSYGQSPLSFNFHR